MVENSEVKIDDFGSCLLQTELIPLGFASAFIYIYMVVIHQLMLVRVGQTKAESAVMNTWLKKKKQNKKKRKKTRVKDNRLDLDGVPF